MCPAVAVVSDYRAIMNAYRDHNRFETTGDRSLSWCAERLKSGRTHILQLDGEDRQDAHPTRN